MKKNKEKGNIKKERKNERRKMLKVKQRNKNEENGKKMV